MNQNVENNEVEIDLLEIFYLLRSKLLLLCLSAIVFATIGFSYTIFAVTPLYSSTSQLYILSQSTSLTSLADIQIGTQLTHDYMELIKSRPVVDEVIKNLALDCDYKKLLEQLTIDNPSDTRILKITATTEDAQMSKKIADEFAQVSKRSISQIMCTDEPSVVAYGYVTDEPVNIHVAKNTVIGALLGLVLVAAIVIVHYLMNDTIRTSEDIEKYLGLNTLAAIPLQAGDKKTKKKVKKKIKKYTKNAKGNKKRG